MSGWIAIHRGWMDCDAFDQDAPLSEREAWLWLIEKAAWKDCIRTSAKGERIKVARGQFHTSLRNLERAWGWGKNKVARYLERLCQHEMIGTASGQSGCVITVCNYDTYQDVRDGRDTETGTASGQSRDTQEQGKQVKQENLEEEEEARARFSGQSFFDAWNSMASGCAARSVHKITANRRTAMRARVEDYTEAIVLETIGMIPSKAWLMGDNEREWTADIDFFLRPDSITKIREGKYDHGNSNRLGPTARAAIAAFGHPDDDWLNEPRAVGRS